MNLTDTHDLLTFIARFDNRRFDDATVLAWHPVLRDLDLADCQRAVAHHVGTSDAYLMPVHIRRIVDDLRVQRQRAINAERASLAIEADQAGRAGRNPVRDRSADVADLLARLRDRLGPSDPTVLRRAEWVREERLRQRRDEGPNVHYQGPPPPGGWPVPDEGTA